MKRLWVCLVLMLLVSLLLSAQPETDSVKLHALIHKALSIKLNKPDSAIFYSRAALAQLTPANRYLNGMAYYSLCYSHWVKANYKLSTEYGFRALRYLENTPHDFERSLVLLELSRTLLDLGNQKEGKRYLEQVFTIAQQYPTDLRILANYYRELSFYYSQSNQLDSAMLVAEKGIALYRAQNDTTNASVLLGRKAKVYLLQERFAEALQVARYSTLLDSLVKNRRGYGVSLYQTAAAMTGLKKYDSAMLVLRKAAVVNVAIGNWMALYGTYTKMSEVLIAQQQPIKAIEHLQLAQRYKDSLYNVSAAGQIEEMKVLYEMEQKDNTIALLEKDNALQAQRTRNQRVMMVSLLAVVILLWAVLFLVMRSQRIQRKANEELRGKNTSIEEQKEEMKLQAEKLQDLNQLKSKLFSVISHDLRGPINNLQALLDLLSRNLLTQEEFLKHSDKLRANVNVTQRTLENLLNWSMSQMEGIRTRPTIMDIRHSIDEAAKLLNDLALRKNIQIENTLTETLLVYADPDQTQVVLRNLIHNGIKFSKTDSQVVVSAVVKDKMCYIRVKDAGIGMTPEELSRLELAKDHFTKVGTLQEKGTGLGLLLCREFVHQNDGTLSVESKAGVGTEITFTLPMA
jgi:two-component system, sensor histidine kinase and response regulator